MGCFKSKTKEPPELYCNDAQLPKESHVLKPSDIEKGKNTKKKGKFTKYRFDPVVSEKYEIKATIGRGSFARVVRVEHKETKQPYAIKVIEVRGSKSTPSKEVLNLEADIDVLRRLKHPNIVQHYEVFECPGRLYVVMELATGGELFERIVSRGYFTERDATRVLYMVLDGVKYLHSQGITHRDLKPENLLYYHPGNESKIMITDFGFAKSLQNPGDTMETTCGSPEYFAPEMLARTSYTNAVDMWAVGVITYILLSGNMPFADDSQARLYRRINKAKYSYRGEPWKDVSRTAKDFIDRLLVLDPETRLTAEDAMKHHWIASSAALSSQKNLHGSFTQNWRKHSASRSGSARSNRSQRSKSGKSNHSQKGTVGIPTEGGSASATKHRQETRLKTGGVSREGDTQVKLSKQLLEKCQSNTSYSEGKSTIDSTGIKIPSNQMDVVNSTLLSIQEIPQEEEPGPCPQNGQVAVFSDLESSYCEEETPTAGTASTDGQGASPEPAALQTMRDNFFSSSDFEDAEEVIQLSGGPKLGLQNEELCRSAKLEGNRVFLELPPKARVHPLSPVPR